MNTFYEVSFQNIFIYKCASVHTCKHVSSYSYHVLPIFQKACICTMFPGICPMCVVVRSLALPVRTTASVSAPQRQAANSLPVSY